MSETIETNGTGSRKRQMTYTWDETSRVLTQHRDGNPVQTFDLAEITKADILERLLVHGLRQKLADSHAGKIDQAEELTANVWRDLVDGAWAVRGAGDGQASLFIEAYAAIKSRPIDEIRQIVNAIEAGDDDDKKALLAKARANKDVVAKMRTLAAERAAARADAAQRAATGEEAVDL